MSLVETVASKASQTNSFVLHPGLSLDSTLFNGLGPGYYLYMPLLYYVYNSPLFDEVLRVELGTRQMKFLCARHCSHHPENIGGAKYAVRRALSHILTIASWLPSSVHLAGHPTVPAIFDTLGVRA